MAKKRTTCRYGKVKSGPRKGRCRKRKVTGAAARKASSKGGRKCQFGVVKRGKRKGSCLKTKRAKKR